MTFRICDGEEVERPVTGQSNQNNLKIIIDRTAQ